MSVQQPKLPLPHQNFVQKYVGVVWTSDGDLSGTFYHPELTPFCSRPASLRHMHLTMSLHAVEAPAEAAALATVPAEATPLELLREAIGVYRETQVAHKEMHVMCKDMMERQGTLIEVLVQETHRNHFHPRTKCNVCDTEFEPCKDYIKTFAAHRETCQECIKAAIKRKPVFPCSAEPGRKCAHGEVHQHGGENFKCVARGFSKANKQPSISYSCTKRGVPQPE